MKKLIGGLAVSAIMALPAFAVPDLQLDVQGGTYVGGADETTYSSGSVFDLYALLHPSNKTPLNGNYRISIAIVPSLAQSTPAPAFGSFSVNGTTYSTAAGNIHFGTPTVEASLNADDLPSHGIFDTYYGEYAFNFNSTHTISTYDVSLGAGDPASHVGGTGSYYNLFNIDASGLAAGYSVHMDLYEVETVTHRHGGVTTTVQAVGTFAPFSHDAQSGGSRVPDGGATLALLGGGILGIGALRRRLSK
ncbi:VPDSG-CTERM sorting domain-containing protein [bacterium]|nr:VPDSG-CTERM sorting domain-containing protein [bacterium]